MDRTNEILEMVAINTDMIARRLGELDNSLMMIASGMQAVHEERTYFNQELRRLLLEMAEHIDYGSQALIDIHRVLDLIGPKAL